MSTLVTEVEDMAGRIGSMKKDANRIEDVLTVIGEISEQTNLLALACAGRSRQSGARSRVCRYRRRRTAVCEHKIALEISIC